MREGLGFVEVQVRTLRVIVQHGSDTRPRTKYHRVEDSSLNSRKSAEKLNWSTRLRERWREGIRHRVTPLGAMMLTLLFTCGILAFTTSQNVFFLLFSLLLASILISSFVNRLMLAGLEVRLELPLHAMAGEPIACSFHVENRKPWIASFALELVAPVGRRFHIPIVQAASRATVPVEVVWSRRGIPEPVIVELSTRFPFGFSIRRTRVAVRITQALYPSIREQAGFAAILNELVSRAGSLAGSAEAEFSHLREYTSGDDWRRIAWGKSASGASWIVKENRSGGEGRLHLWLDTSSPHFELLIDLAAYLVWELQFRNTKFIFSAANEQIEVSDRREAYTILRMLSVITPSSMEPPTHDSSLFILSFNLGHLPVPADALAAAAARPHQRDGF